VIHVTVGQQDVPHGALLLDLQRAGDGSGVDRHQAVDKE